MSFEFSFDSENQDSNISEPMSTPSLGKLLLPCYGSPGSHGSHGSPGSCGVSGVFGGDLSEVSMLNTPMVIDLDGQEGQEDADEGAEGVEEEAVRKRREEEEASERLAWELMEAEQTALYNMQLAYIQSTVMSEEDKQAMEQILRPEEDQEDQDEEEWAEEDDYDRLLALGQALGDVKTERWRLRSQQLIDSLPVRIYGEVLNGCAGGVIDLVTPPRPPVSMSSHTLPMPPNPFTPSALRTTGPAATGALGCAHSAAIPHPPTPSTPSTDRCSICMEHFLLTEQVVQLPCKHLFHPLCAAGWIKDHNSCASCTVKIVKSPTV